ncbi:hypothetical protein DSECCO2_629450 [anaerobic digester metagenome]
MPVQAVEEVAAEAAVLDHPAQVAVGGRDDAEVAGDLLLGPDGPELAFLQDA